MMKRSLIFSFVALVLLVVCTKAGPLGRGFVRTQGTRFVANGKTLYLNGFNAYWMMYAASNPSLRDKVTNTLFQASRYGVNVARTWAFSDGGNEALQISPGTYNENTFKALDFVVTEAQKHGIYLILSFVNNFNDFGGRKQYVQWARENGQVLENDDAFYSNPVTKDMYKNHINKVVTRINSITGIAYKDDPTIFSWELMNEPRCESDQSGKTMQSWVEEMSAYVKSLDNKHLLEIGLEGFYGEQKKQSNPRSYVFGTDFISNNQISGIDFATIHLYPDQWLSNSISAVSKVTGKWKRSHILDVEELVSNDAVSNFTGKWIQDHIDDAKSVLEKPLILAEFGKSSKLGGYSTAARDEYYGNIYGAIYQCARRAGPCAGALFWQLIAQGLENMGDGYEVVLEQGLSTNRVIHKQSRRMSGLTT